MSRLSNYLDTNSLTTSAKVWLSGKDTSTIISDTSTFTWKNKLGEVDYDFLQSNASLHPVYSPPGVTFVDDDKLYPRVNDLFTAVSSYSIILISEGSDFSLENKILSIGKSNPLIPKFLEYSYKDSKVEQQFSLVNIQNILKSTGFLTSQQTVGINHTLKYGLTRISINKDPFQVQINSDKGHVFNNYPGNFYLGNSNTNLPFTGKLLHFLVFIPEISETHINNIIDILLLQYIWDELAEDDWNSITNDDWDIME